MQNVHIGYTVQYAKGIFCSCLVLVAMGIMIVMKEVDG